MIRSLHQIRGECLSSSVCKKSQYWFAFSTDENSETLERSAINDGRSMLAMFQTVLYKVEGIENVIAGFSAIVV